MDGAYFRIHPHDLNRYRISFSLMVRTSEFHLYVAYLRLKEDTFANDTYEQHRLTRLMLLVISVSLIHVILVPFFS